MLSETPRYRNGKVVGVQTIPNLVSVKSSKAGDQLVNAPMSLQMTWQGAKQAYVKWSTAEFVEGRPCGPTTLSTAKQVVGAVQRLLVHSKQSLNGTFAITTAQVKAYVDHLTSLGRRPTYIADQVAS